MQQKCAFWENNGAQTQIVVCDVCTACRHKVGSLALEGERKMCVEGYGGQSSHVTWFNQLSVHLQALCTTSGRGLAAMCCKDVAAQAGCLTGVRYIVLSRKSCSSLSESWVYQPDRTLYTHVMNAAAKDPVTVDMCASFQGVLSKGQSGQNRKCMISVSLLEPPSAVKTHVRQ